jgi:hypothetical protein
MVASAATPALLVLEENCHWGLNFKDTQYLNQSRYTLPLAPTSEKIFEEAGFENVTSVVHKLDYWRQFLSHMKIDRPNYLTKDFFGILLILCPI